MCDDANAECYYLKKKTNQSGSIVFVKYRDNDPLICVYVCVSVEFMDIAQHSLYFIMFIHRHRMTSKRKRHRDIRVFEQLV